MQFVNSSLPSSLVEAEEENENPQINIQTNKSPPAWLKGKKRSFIVLISVFG